MNLTAPANVQWAPGDKVSTAPEPESRQQDFPTLWEAVQFVTETLSPAQRASVLLTTGGARLQIAEIEQIRGGDGFKTIQTVANNVDQAANAWEAGRAKRVDNA